MRGEGGCVKVTWGAGTARDTLCVCVCVCVSTLYGCESCGRVLCVCLRECVRVCVRVCMGVRECVVYVFVCQQ